MTMSTRIYKMNETTIKSKADAKRVLENVVLKQGTISFPHADDDQYRFQISPSHLKTNDVGTIIDKKPVSELTDEQKKISVSSYEVKNMHDPFALFTVRYDFDGAVNKLYKIRRHYNAHHKKRMDLD